MARRRAAFFIVMGLGLLMVLGLSGVGNTQANAQQFVLRQGIVVNSGGSLSGGGFAFSYSLGQAFDPLTLSGGEYQLVPGIQQEDQGIYRLYLPLIGR